MSHRLTHLMIVSLLDITNNVEPTYLKYDARIDLHMVARWQYTHSQHITVPQTWENNDLSRTTKILPSSLQKLDSTRRCVLLWKRAPCCIITIVLALINAFFTAQRVCPNKTHLPSSHTTAVVATFTYKITSQKNWTEIKPTTTSSQHTT